MNIRILFIIPFLTLTVLCHSIVPKIFNYNAAWDEVSKLQQKGLPQSMLEKVQDIYNAARKDGNTDQQIKALIYKLTYLQNVEENSNQKAINTVEEEMKNVTFPASAILHSMLAQMYWSYYESNRWQLQSRTETINFVQDDIATWDLKTITKKAIFEYQLSLERADDLKKLSIKQYNLVIRAGDEDSQIQRPTLYDFLAHRALDFYMGDESGITKPADEFLLSDNLYFQPVDLFAKMKIVSPDTLSLKFQALCIMQDLINLHLNDESPDALVAVDIDRLEFVYDNTSMNDKEMLFESALRNQINKFGYSKISALSAYTLASLLKELGDGYKPDISEKYRWNYKNALELCDVTLEKYIGDNTFKSSYVHNCLTVLKNLILDKTSDIQIENVVPKNQPIKALVKIKNLTQLQVRIYKLNFSDKMKDDRERSYDDNKDYIAKVIKKAPLLEKKFMFQDEGDYRQHSSEIALPSLQFGRYLIVASDDFTKSITEQNISFIDFSCSDLSCITQNIKNSTILVSSRQFGTPLQNVIVMRNIQKWDGKLNKYEYLSDWKGKSDRFGKLIVPGSQGYWNGIYILSLDKDTLIVGNLNLYSNRDKPTVHKRCILFTDRAIYRPGQTIYFKGIFFETDMIKQNNILPHTDVNVILYDVNMQQISTLDLFTNEYGTFNGTFTAPKNTLTGTMQVYTKFGSASISVEEYKRPSFEVTVDKPIDTYQLGQSVSIKGHVMSYAGFPIDHAKVAYRITRQPRWYFWYWWWGSRGTTADKEIAKGSIVTNQKGEFDLSFIAQGDDTISNFGDPYFVFTINADATDQNGETRSGSLGLGIGKTNLILDPMIKETVNLDNKKFELPIKATNLSGEPVSVRGSLTITLLKSPNRVQKNRIWDKPEIFYMTRDEFLKLFPNDIYEDENFMSKWDKEKQVFKSQFDTSQKSPLVVTNIDEWDQGAYVLEVVSLDKYQKEVKSTRYFTLYSAKGKQIPYPMADWFVPIKSSGEPGEKASFLIGSGYDKVSVLYEIERNGIIEDSMRFNLNKEQRLFTVPINESDRGNFSVHFTFIRDNRVYTHNQDITVPWTNKKLDFEYMTYRNKLIPGQDEEWRLKIKDYTGGLATAEVLATMYDASLDAFRTNNWYMDLYHSVRQRGSWNTYDFVTPMSLMPVNYHNIIGFPSRQFSSLNWYDYNLYTYSRRISKGKVGSGRGGMLYADGLSVETAGASTALQLKKSAGTNEMGHAQAGLVNIEPTVSEDQAGSSGGPGEDLSGIQARSNFAETAFFYPELRTDEDGEVSIVFTAPESLTRWKFRALALTKELNYGITDSTMVTQKPLMVIPNAPRFFREGDKITFSSKISSTDDIDQSGICQLFLFDAISMQPIESLLKLKNAQKSFTVKKGESTVLEWDLFIPFGIDAVTYRVVAKAGNFSDGEEKTIPVLSNRMLVTESLPLPVRGHSKKSFIFNKFKNGGFSNTIKNFKLTLEFTSNPAWYAVQALPYMMEYPYECNEQIFARFYANSIASFIANSNPRIKKVFDSWKNTPNSEALLSNLEKNQELKSVILQETPWVLDAKNETERKHRVGLLFDLNRMADEFDRNLNKLEQAQMPNGAWSWFRGMPDSWWVTQYIVEGFGHLDKLGVKAIRMDQDIWGMNQRAITYLDHRIVEDYDNIFKHGNEKLDNLGYLEIHYLYTRSFFLDITMDKSVKKAVDYFKEQADAYWLTKGRYGQGMLALAMKRLGNNKLPVQIIASLKEHALNSEEMGMYWKDNISGWFWYEAPIETQSLLIEAFNEVAKDTTSVDGMRTWLLKQKQTTNWKTTKATAEACYALLLSGTEWLTTDKLSEISLGDQIIDPKKLDGTQVEAGTGYFKTSWSGGDIQTTMADVTVTNPNDVPAWGALYWQYFENLDKITTAETPLKLNKKLFIERKTATGVVLDPISIKSTLHVGDKVIVRIELRSDRNMEYVHMKDMRSSGFEPINVLSQYKWQDGLGYYEATGDASTNFFIEYLHKGTYVFEYPLWVTNKGDFSNGITTIQCMYAPEFTSHSEGIRVEVK
jgi:hypothetical protein